MRIKKFSLWSAVAVLGLVASLTCANQAQAQVTTGNDLNLGGNYNNWSWTLTEGSTTYSGGGGSITPSYLNGVKLPWVYCIDIPDNVGVPADYNNTTVSTNGTAMFGGANPWTGGTAGTTFVGSSSSSYIASQVAWILDNYANAAVGSSSTQIAAQEAVQSAIWRVIYGTVFTVQDNGVNTAMNNILTALGTNTAALNSVFWLSPNGNGQNGAAGPGLEQALVTAAVPEPSTFAIASLCGAGFIFYGLRRRKAVVA